MEAPYEFIQFEVLDEEECITDDDEVWSEIDDSECDDTELSNINFDEDTICERLEEVFLKWRETHKNSNVRGAGTSRATYFRDKEAKQLLHQGATNYSTPITNWFQPKEPKDISDDTFIADMIQNPVPLNERIKSSEEPKFTIMTAMEHLIQHEAKLSKNKQINKKMAKEINFWYYVCSLALYQYFAHIR